MQTIGEKNKGQGPGGYPILISPLEDGVHAIRSLRHIARVPLQGSWVRARIALSEKAGVR